GAASEQHLGANPRIPAGLAAPDPAYQGLSAGDGLPCRRKIPAVARNGEADHRGGQPGRILLIGGKPLEDLFSHIQRGSGGLTPARRPRDRSRDRSWLSFWPRRAARPPRDPIARAPPASRLDDLVDR